MKQLEPILKYHFWILLGVGLIMAFTGWWMTTGQMQAAITQRRTKIEEAKKKVPDPKTIPSRDWEEKLKRINVEQDKLIRQSRDWLYARQKEKMVWPEVIREEAAKLKYMDDFKNQIHHINYRDHYLKEVQRVYEIPRPITPYTSDGVVMFPMSAMPQRDWGGIPPTSKQMWESMEDLWLLEPILQAILETNGGEKASKFEASILVIELLKLKGGDRSKIGQAGDAGGGGSSANFGGGGANAALPAGAGAFGAGGGEDKGAGNVGMAAAGSYSIDIKSTEVFGDPGNEGGDAGNAAGQGGGANVALPPAGFGAGAGENKAGGGGAGANSEDIGRRYIDDDPNLPYRTRGFMLTVVMDHRKVPELFAQLTSSERSPWPIKIERMNIARLDDASSLGGEFGRPMMGAGGGGFGGAGGPMFGGGANVPAAGRGGAGGLARGELPTSDTTSAADQIDRSFLARVSLAGLITLYNEPPKSEEPAATPAPSTGAPEGTSAAAATGEEDDADEDSAVPAAKAADDEDEEMESPAGKPFPSDSDDEDAVESPDDQPEMKPEIDEDEPAGDPPAVESNEDSGTEPDGDAEDATEPKPDKVEK